MLTSRIFGKDLAMPIGTYDFWTDAADVLEPLDVDYLILVREPGSSTVNLVSNTADPETLRLFTLTVSALHGDKDEGP